jgi:hypothetical protein
MNERIKELAEQAGIQEDLVDNLKDEVEVLTYIARPQDIQKFAELIIRKCAKVADLAEENKCEWIGGNILNHFGVEE